MAKRAGRVGFGSGQSGRGLKRVTGQNGSFLNGLIGLRVKRVAGQTGLTRFAMSNHISHNNTLLTPHLFIYTVFIQYIQQILNEFSMYLKA